MKIVYVNIEGKTAVITCQKIEPATLRSPGSIIVDEGEMVLDMRDVIKIIDG